MPTFLVTHKMAPELAARVSARVSGRRARSDGSKRSPRLVVFVRLALVALVVAIVAGVVHVRQADASALETERGALLDRIAANARALSPDDRRFVASAERALADAAARFEGELLADELRGPGALRALLARPLLYARVEAAVLARQGAAGATAGMSKDAFVVCLLAPPERRTETALLRSVYTTYSTHSRLEAPTANVRLLSEAKAGLPFVAEPFTARVRAAKAMPELRRLQKAFDQAPLASAIAAAKARIFVAVVDEASDHSGPAELDGENPHGVRIAIVDLENERTLLRSRRRVDPSWISDARRSEHARGLDSCSLALDVHAAVREGAPL
jgi:hypothetical protein